MTDTKTLVRKDIVLNDDLHNNILELAEAHQLTEAETIVLERIVRLKPPFQPRGDYVLVTQEDYQEKVGELYIPDKAQQRPQHGFVLAVGEEVREVRPGDRVLYTKLAGKDIQIDGYMYLMMKEVEIYGSVGVVSDLDIHFTKKEPKQLQAKTNGVE